MESGTWFGGLRRKGGNERKEGREVNSINEEEREKGKEVKKWQGAEKKGNGKWK